MYLIWGQNFEEANTLSQALLLHTVGELGQQYLGAPARGSWIPESPKEKVSGLALQPQQAVTQVRNSPLMFRFRKLRLLEKLQF